MVAHGTGTRRAVRIPGSSALCSEHTATVKRIRKPGKSVGLCFLCRIRAPARAGLD